MVTKINYSQDIKEKDSLSNDSIQKKPILLGKIKRNAR